MKAVLNQCHSKKPVYGGIIDENELQKNLRDNCVPDGFEMMDISNYSHFLDARRVLMARKIKEYYFTL